MIIYNVGTWDTSETLTEGLRGREGFETAQRLAAAREEPVLLWAVGRSPEVWRVDPSGASTEGVLDGGVFREQPHAD